MNREIHVRFWQSLGVKFPWATHHQTSAHRSRRNPSTDMHHKRQRPKSRRAGCLLCKPNKMSGWPKNELGHTGFGKLRREIAAGAELRSQE